MKSDVIYTCFDTALGKVYAAATMRGICRLTIGRTNVRKFEKEITRTHGRRPRKSDLLGASLKRDFDHYCRGRRVAWNYDCDISLVTEFQRTVLEKVRRIPFGETRTYGDIARAVYKHVSAARAVGGAVGANPVPIIIPCHRVVAAQFSEILGRGKIPSGPKGLGGFGLGLKLKKRLLNLEGVLPQKST